MKMALKKSHEPAIWIIIMLTLGCNLPGPSQNSSPDAETQPETPTQENAGQAVWQHPLIVQEMLDTIQSATGIEITLPG